MRKRWLFLSLAALLSVLAQAQDPKAPPFSGKDLKGKAWTEHSAGYVLVDFWASWCVPCLHEIPSLNALQAKHQAPGRFSVLGICMDEGGLKAAKAAAIKHKVAYPVLAGSTKMAEAYGLKGFPSAVLLKDGKVVKVLTGERNLAAFERDLALVFAP